MAITLGLDIGTSSVGWCLIDDVKKKIVGIGVRIFPEGVNDLGDKKEQSKNAARTQFRQSRRRFYRRFLRRSTLLKILQSNGLAPDTEEGIEDWNRLNPYELRAKGTTEMLSVLEVGRIFYHLNQRRGFQTNSKSAIAKEGAIFKSADGKVGINDTKEAIGDNTLGIYLNEILPKHGQPFKMSDAPRVRARYTTRAMYRQEFDLIWEKQSEYHANLTKELKTVIADKTIFYQMPLRSQKHLIGKCILETTKRRCAMSHFAFEEFRVWQTVNNIHCNGNPLNAKDRTDIATYLLESKEKVKMKTLRTVLNKKSTANFSFNFEDADEFAGATTVANLATFQYNGRNWNELAEKDKEDIWHIAHAHDDVDWIIRHTIEKWNFSEEEADRFAHTKLKDGFASLSLKAIKLILPFLKMGFTYDLAVAFAGVKKVFGERWETITDQSFLIDNVESIVKSAFQGGYIPVLKEFLKQEYQFTDSDLTKLYHHSTETEKRSLLPEIPMTAEMDKQLNGLKNPIVTKALFEVRKVVNAIIGEYGKPDRINIELARDLKATAKKRFDIRMKQIFNRKKRDNATFELSKIGVAPNHFNIQKYLLWEEAGEKCVYTGQQFGVKDLFNGKVDIEHIVPYSMSLDDGFGNLTICDAHFNRHIKSDGLPIQTYNRTEWLEVKARAATLFTKTRDYPNRYNKYLRFITEEYKNDDFLARHLNDTRYINVKAKEMLYLICDDVAPLAGQLTAKLRHLWGLNRLLPKEDESKNRNDHRHHAIDALVIASTSRSNINVINKWSRMERHHGQGDFPEPWRGFWDDAKTQVEGILISNANRRRVVSLRTVKVKKNGQVYENKSIAARDALHEESVYGKRQAPKQEKPSYHIKKSLDSISTEKHIKDIVDDNIREIVRTYWNSEEYKIQKSFFKIEDGIKKSCVFLKNSKGDAIPIRSVRMRYEIGNAAAIGENKYVNPKNNHHVIIYKDTKGKLKDVVTDYWTAVERARNNEPICQLPEDGVEILTTFKHNDNFIFGLTKDEILANENNFKFLFQYLYKVKKFTKGAFYFIHHSVSGSHNVDTYKYDRSKDFVEKSIYRSAFSFNGIKVALDVLGKKIRIID